MSEETKSFKTINELKQNRVLANICATKIAMAVDDTTVLDKVLYILWQVENGELTEDQGEIRLAGILECKAFIPKANAEKIAHAAVKGIYNPLTWG